MYKQACKAAPVVIWLASRPNSVAAICSASTGPLAKLRTTCKNREAHSEHEV